MASQKQIAANRKNAQASTGARTPEGKSKSRCNAIRDGLTGQITTLSPEDQPIFEQLKAEMLADLRPQNSLERKLANSIAWDTWRLDHLRAVETNVYALGREEDREAREEDDPDNSDPATQPDPIDLAFADARTYRGEARRFELMSLYESRMTRNIHRNVTLLRELQAERKRNYERDKKEEVQIARLCEFNDMPIRASTAPSKNGFVFSNEEIAVAAVRDRYVATAAHVFKHTNPVHQYGGLLAGAGDSILARILDKRPLSTAERNEIHSVPPEARAVHRLNHPEEYGIRPHDAR
jgi:hypothetical protein